MSDRRLAFTRRVELDEASGAYAVISLGSSAERIDMIERSKSGISNDESRRVMIEQTKKHFISGRVPVVSEGAVSMVPMEAEDIDALPTAQLDDLWLTINGWDLDPKASSVTTESTSEAPSELPSLPRIELSTTATTSSEA